MEGKLLKRMGMRLRVEVGQFPFLERPKYLCEMLTQSVCTSLLNVVSFVSFRPPSTREGLVGRKSRTVSDWRATKWMIHLFSCPRSLQLSCRASAQCLEQNTFQVVFLTDTSPAFYLICCCAQCERSSTMLQNPTPTPHRVLPRLQK